MENLFLDPTLILIIAAFAGFFMAFGIGANDVANAMGTSVGSKAITFKQAIFIASTTALHMLATCDPPLLRPATCNAHPAVG